MKKLDGHIKIISFLICFILFQRICFPRTYPITSANFCSANFRAEFLQDEVQAVRSFLKHKLLNLTGKAGGVNSGNSLSELTEIR